jgi:hypothetical protein
MDGVSQLSTTKSEQEEALSRLKETIREGDTIYSFLRHRYAPGTAGVIRLFLILPDNDNTRQVHVHQISKPVAKALGCAYEEDRDGITVEDWGKDMGFHLVYSLGRLLFPDGGSADKSARNSELKGMHETDGGYLLHHKWL